MSGGDEIQVTGARGGKWMEIEVVSELIEQYGTEVMIFAAG